VIAWLKETTFIFSFMNPSRPVSISSSDPQNGTGFSQASFTVPLTSLATLSQLEKTIYRD